MSVSFFRTAATLTNMSKLKFFRNQLYADRTLLRAKFNWHIRGKSFSGRGIDFGAKDASNEYYKLMDISQCKMVFCDYYHADGDSVRSIDFEQDFDLENEQFDFAFCFNVLEHIFNYQKFVCNIEKSLRPGGVLEGYVPFLHQYHADPNDYFRYTHQSLERILLKAGFIDVEVTPIGIGAFTAGLHLAGMGLRHRRARPLIWFLWKRVEKWDAWLTQRWPRNKTFYLGVAFRGLKKSL